MSTTTTTLFTKRSVYTGVAVVLATILFGGVVAVGAGFGTPAGVFAEEEAATATVSETAAEAAPAEDAATTEAAAETTTAEAETVVLPDPSCTITANKYELYDDEDLIITWTTQNASLFSINNDIGFDLSPTAGGSITIHPPLIKQFPYSGTAFSAAKGVGQNCLLPHALVVTPRPATPTPSCTLRDVRSIDANGKLMTTLSWTTQNADVFGINHGHEGLTPVAAGSITIPTTATTTYIGTAFAGTIPTGFGSSCDAVVTLPPGNPPPPPPDAPTCTLKAVQRADIDYNNDGVITGALGADLFSLGDAAIVLKIAVGIGSCPVGKICDLDGLNGINTDDARAVLAFADRGAPAGPWLILWHAANSTIFGIDHGITAHGDGNGIEAVNPQVTTTYTGTATAGDQSDTCTVTIPVPTDNPAPACTLIASPPGTIDTSRIDYNDDGALTDADAEMLLQVAVGSRTCPAGKVCDVNGDGVVRTVNDESSLDAQMVLLYVHSLPKTGTHILQWTSTNANAFSIDHGVNAQLTTAIGTQGVSPTETTTYTGTATGPGGSATCSVTITIGGGGGGGDDDNNDDGGGHHSSGSRPRPEISLSSTGTVAGASIALSQIPYTGLDLGPTGTVLYWLALIAWSLALAYLVLFGAMPATRRYALVFGGRVSEALNTRERAATPVMRAVTAPPAPVKEERHEAARGYSAFDGFKSFAKNEALSIEDIVKGLTHAHKIPAAAPAAMTEPVYSHVEPIYDTVEPIEAPESMTKYVAEVTGVPADVRGFTSALVQGDREALFAGLRQHVRGGGSVETLISSVAFLLDDVYRARLDGTACDPDLARLTARLSTPTLEKLVASLTTAIDSSYSTDVTGAKIALTRALATLGA